MNAKDSQQTSGERLQGKRAAVLLFSHYPSDPRPRRAAEALVQLGMRVEIISLKQSDKDPARETFNGVEILRIPMKRRRGGKAAYLFEYGSFIVASWFILAFRSLRRRYHLVHVHNMPDVLVFAALIPRLLGAKVLLDLHDPMPELMMTIFGLERKSRAVRLLCWLEKMSMACAHAVLTVNIACKRIFSSRSCSAEKISVVMNAPDESIFALRDVPAEATAATDPEKPFVIMYHGSLVERHGLDIAVTALGRIKRSIPKAELRVYGRSTPYLEKTLSSVTEPGLRASIHCLGGKDLPQIAEAIRECDVGVIPNRRSIFTELNTPTRIFEYLSQGKPVIAPAAPGIQDYFGENDLIYFELGNPEDLAARLEYVFAHPKETERIVRRGLEVYAEHKWSSERKRFLDLVGALLHGKGQPQTEAGGYRPLEVET